MTILLDKWDGAELFNKIIFRFDAKESIKNLMSTERFKSKLIDYSRKELNYKVTKDIYKNYSSDNKKQNASAFYNFCRQLHHGEPVILKKEVFEAFVKYIEEEDFAGDTKIICNDFKLNQKQREFESTKWWVYFYDECFLPASENKTVLYKGVSRAILHLKPFGKAELVRLKKEKNEKRVYTGIYRVCKHDEYLAFKLKTKKNRERDLRMLFYIGTDNMNLSLGLSANTSDSFYSRTVMMEPINTKIKKQEPGFYCKEITKEKNNDLPDYVWAYFKETEKNIIRLPQKKITTPDKLKDWLKMK